MAVKPTLADKTDIELEDMVTKVSDDLTSGNVMFNGEPPTKDALDYMMKAIKMGMISALEEQKNKRKK